MKFRIFHTQYRVGKKQFRWRLIGDNGKIVANSGESYKNRGDLMAAIGLVHSTNAKTEIEDLTKEVSK